MFAALIDTVVDFKETVFRNIPSVVPSEDLLDDLSDDPKARAYGEALVAVQQDADYRSPIIMRPFLYGVSLDGTRLPTRFSDGRRFGVWYGSLEMETTIHETVYHWKKRLKDMLITIAEEVVSERRVFEVVATGLFIDLRGKHDRFPGLIDKDDYTFTHALGEYLNRNNQSALLVQSARFNGINLAAFRPDVLSNPRQPQLSPLPLEPGRTRTN